MSKHIVVVILEGKPGKEQELQAVLQDVAEQSKKESSNVLYQVYQDNDNPRVFILHENWQSKELHAQQFEKPYIKDFIGKLDDLLVKPFQAHMASEV